MDKIGAKIFVFWAVFPYLAVGFTNIFEPTAIGIVSVFGMSAVGAALASQAVVK